MFSEMSSWVPCQCQGTGCVDSLCVTLSPLPLQTLYTHIVTDIKNVNAKHKNNKVNTVSALAFMSALNSPPLLLWETSEIMFSPSFLGTAELHVHNVEGQPSHCCQDISGCDGGALQKEYLVGLAGLFIVGHRGIIGGM